MAFHLVAAASEVAGQRRKQDEVGEVVLRVGMNGQDFCSAVVVVASMGGWGELIW